jgi:5-methylcytosine-specific restriction endonuclease McrA
MGTVLSLITLAKTRPMFGSVSRAPTRPMLLAPALTASWPGAQNASTRAASPGAIVSLGPTTRLRLTKPFGPAGPKGPHWPMGQGDRPSIHQYQWHRKSRRPPSRSSTACRAPCGKRAASAWTWTLSSSSTRRSWSASTTSRPGFREPAPWAVRSRVDQSKKLSARARCPIPESVRHEVWRRDEGRCVDCGSRVNLEYDHIVPVSGGGSNTARNIELRCESCNRQKGARV